MWAEFLTYRCSTKFWRSRIFSGGHFWHDTLLCIVTLYICVTGVCRVLQLYTLCKLAVCFLCAKFNAIVGEAEIFSLIHSLVIFFTFLLYIFCVTFRVVVCGIDLLCSNCAFFPFHIFIASFSFSLAHLLGFCEKAYFFTFSSYDYFHIFSTQVLSDIYEIYVYTV